MTPASTVARPAGGYSPFMAFMARLHSFIGLFVGPFLIIAALTGVFYVLTPQVDEHLYRDQLVATTPGEPQPLLKQIGAASAWLREQGRPEQALFAVRPARAEGHTSRIMYKMAGARSGESLGVFVDPVSLKVQGALVVYGTSGTLPFRGFIDYIHRDLGLGEPGRYYSEAAASWAWIAVVGGLLLWVYRRAVLGRPKDAGVRGWHTRVGLWIALGVLFFSATGMTWSKWAGELRIEQIRTELGWVTPPLKTALDPAKAAAPADPHEEHGHVASAPAGGAGHGGDVGGGHTGAAHDAHAVNAQPGGGAAGGQAAGSGHTGAAHDVHAGGVVGAVAVPLSLEASVDPVLKAARDAGIDAPGLEIRPPKQDGHAWTVREIDRHWPTQVDSVAVDPRNMQVVSRSDFETFPLIAKLIRWGIDLHMGVLFGLPNQLIIAALALALAVMVVLGYVMWWRRAARRPVSARDTLWGAWLHMGVAGRLAVVLFLALFGWLLPVLAMSLGLFLLIDVVRYLTLRARAV